MNINDSMAMTLQAIARHQAGEVDAARLMYRLALCIDPSNVDALHCLGTLEKRNFSPHGAFKNHYHAIIANPQSSVARVNFISSYIYIYENKLHNTDIDDLLISAIIFLRKKEFEDKDEYISSIVSYAYKVALLYFRDSNIDASRFVTESILSELPDSDDFINLKNIISLTEDPVRAIEFFKNMTASDGINYNQIGNYKHYLGKAFGLLQSLLHEEKRDESFQVMSKIYGIEKEILLNIYNNTVNRKLTIAIPTWNRAKTLKPLLDDLAHQVSLIDKENIAIVISDNGSTDETEEVVKCVSSQYDFVFYSKNYKNIGFMANMIKLVSTIDSEYVWFFGDDEKLGEGAIASVRSVVNSSNSELIIYTEHSGYGFSIGDLFLQGTLINVANKAGLFKLLNFISVIIVKPKGLRKTNFTNYLEDPFIHVSMIFEAYANSMMSMHIGPVCMRHHQNQLSNYQERWTSENVQISFVKSINSVKLAMDTINIKAVKMSFFEFITYQYYWHAIYTMGVIFISNIKFEDEIDVDFWTDYFNKMLTVFDLIEPSNEVEQEKNAMTALVNVLQNYLISKNIIKRSFDISRDKVLGAHSTFREPMLRYLDEVNEKYKLCRLTDQPTRR